MLSATEYHHSYRIFWAVVSAVAVVFIVVPFHRTRMISNLFWRPKHSTRYYSNNMETTTLTTPEENELATLTHSIIEWRRLKEDNDIRKQQVRESGTKMKALEEIILNVMKSHNIGALDLKGSGGRILYRRSSSKSGMNDKVLFNLLSEHMKSETSAAAAVKYINEHRDTKAKESLVYEKD